MDRSPKYQKVLELILRKVEKSEPGDRLPSIRALMAEFKVSQSRMART